MRPTPTSSSPGAWAGCSKASTTRAEPPPSTPCGQLRPPTRPPTASPSPRPHGSPPPGGAEQPLRQLRLDLLRDPAPAQQADGDPGARESDDQRGGRGDEQVDHASAAATRSSIC